MRPPVLKYMHYAFPSGQAYIHMSSESLKIEKKKKSKGVKEHVCVSGAAHCIQLHVRHTGPFISNSLSLSLSLTSQWCRYENQLVFAGEGEWGMATSETIGQW